MNILIVKTSSMGDIIHTLPALTDAQRAIPQLKVDWLVEESFQEIPRWHPAVNKVFPLMLRRFRKQKFLQGGMELLTTIRQLRADSYDRIIDAQGLVKSAFFSALARGMRYGFHRNCVRESFAAYFYDRTISVDKTQHAVTRIRQLFAGALQYEWKDSTPDYGLNRAQFNAEPEPPYLLFLHGTTWNSKLWPESYWQRLAQIAIAQGFHIKLLWGNAEEKARADRIAQAVHAPQIIVLPRLPFMEIAKVIANATKIVGVDTGFTHLAAAFAVPTVSIYGSTDAKRTGALGFNQHHLQAEFSCAPCFARNCQYKEPAAVSPACYTSLPPEKVWEVLEQVNS